MKNNQMHIKFFFRLVALYFFWISFYGVSVLIIHNGDNFALSNPITPHWLKAVDEVILVFISLWLGMLFKRKIIGKELNRDLKSNLLVSTIPLGILVFFDILGFINTLDFKYILLTKNAISAILVTCILYFIYVLNFLRKLINFFLRILSLSIIVGLFHYLTFPYEVYGDRLIGTYLNPNVVGYVCFFGIALGHYSWNKWQNSTIFPIFPIFTILVFAIGGSASGSLSSLILIFAYLVTKLLLHFIERFRSQSDNGSLRIIFLTILIVTCGHIINHNFIQLDENNFLMQKLHSINDLSTSNTSVALSSRVSILNSLKSEIQNSSAIFSMYFQSDSSIYNFLYNYPPIFFYTLIISFIFSFCYIFILKKQNFFSLVKNPMAYFILFSIFPFMLVQYVLEEIPPLILFVFAYTLLVIDSSELRK